ncbi:MAG TPA: hypothetical protein VEG25_05890 [Burkholderiales bacterium]|nr:hypothetical protein [Burkholderiales bacterium]
MRFGSFFASVITIFVVLAAGLIARANSAVNVAGMKAADGDMASILSEGTKLVEDKNALNKKFEEHVELKKKMSTDVDELDKWMAKWNEQTKEFNTRCNRDFHEWQEAEYAKCKAEYERDMPLWKEKETEKQQLTQRAQLWRTEDERLNREKRAFYARQIAWQKKAKELPPSVRAVPEMSAKMSECFAKQRGELEAVVNSFQTCWDETRKVGVLAIKQGTRFVQAPGNSKTANQNQPEATDQYDTEQSAHVEKYNGTDIPIATPLKPGE